MTDALTQLVVWLNVAANGLGRVLLAPVGVLPGWLSATLIALASGVFFLFIFKYTSDQRAIKRVRDDISANLLALKLFKDSALVALRCQGRVLGSACRLLPLTMVPIIVMIVPVSLLLGQLSLWYEARPLRDGEEAVVTLRLHGEPVSAWPEVSLQAAPFVAVSIGPVRINSRREICWNIQARQNGYHRLVFHVDGQTVDKELAIGDGFMRVSVRRPGWQWSDALTHPAETPFSPQSPVQSIAIDYPERSSWTSGTGSWVIYWFVGSMVSGFCFRRLLKVNI